MDKKTQDATLRMLKEFDISEDEKKFIDYADTAVTNEMNHSRVLSTLLLTKQLKESTGQIIESNNSLAEAEGKNSRIMQWLTFALICVGAIQAIGIILDIICVVRS